ncbi:hypothetical protein Lepto7375DRAFT_7244 [Leptolyngbya sp. PCC 7375]|nr:hypothetical protein Lepto7375DRAFT_7244 [Leptolyngbya sp. PCC 7375]
MPTSQQSITIRIPSDLKDWIKDHISNSRTQTGLFTEALILYYRAYLYIKPHLRRLVSTDYSEFINPVISPEHYELLSTLNTGRGNQRSHKQVGNHLRNAITIYSKLYQDVAVYNIHEIDIQDDELGVIHLLEEVEIINLNTGAFKR